MSGQMVPRRDTALMMSLSMVLTGVVIVAVNVQIYLARYLYGYYNPDAVSRRPATISRAISDPQVGEPFANWMLVCAPLLAIGVALLIISALIELHRNGGAPTQKEWRILVLLCLVLIALQVFAAIGMVMLSQFRFPNDNKLHMKGSYLFFFSQAFVVMFGEFVSRRFGKLPQDRTLLSFGMARFRKFYVWVPILLGVLYLSLFFAKDFDLGAVNPPLYILYTTTEPLLLTAYLGYVLTYHADMGAAVRRYLRA
ncbi:hypothetical protein [Shimia sediminis]|uniref:hypothetical protein n=1 Tax=Shimia sediminis TaxID=2497945 RepID=UPI000F8D773D|nr:hypothetical protein [Shimia sediminis]